LTDKGGYVGVLEVVVEELLSKGRACEENDGFPVGTEACEMGKFWLVYDFPELLYERLKRWSEIRHTYTDTRD
jgi:hypothetical protein